MLKTSGKQKNPNRLTGAKLDGPVHDYVEAMLAPELERVRQARTNKGFDISVANARIIQIAQVAVFLLAMAFVIFQQAILAYAIFGGLLASLGGLSAAVAVALLSGTLISSTTILCFLLRSVFKTNRLRSHRFRHPLPVLADDMMHESSFHFAEEAA